MNKVHGSSNKIHVLRTKIRVLFVFFKKYETPLVFSILADDPTGWLSVRTFLSGQSIELA